MSQQHKRTHFIHNNTNNTSSNNVSSSNNPSNLSNTTQQFQRLQPDTINNAFEIVHLKTNTSKTKSSASVKYESDHAAIQHSIQTQYAVHSIDTKPIRHQSSVSTLNSVIQPSTQQQQQATTHSNVVHNNNRSTNTSQSIITTTTSQWTQHYSHISNNYIAALCEFRNKGTIGLAMVDTIMQNMILVHYTDNNTYAHTMSLFTLYTPQKVLVPELSVESALVNLIDAELRDICDILPTKRTYFNEAYGIQQLQQYGKTEDVNKLQLSNETYLMQSAVGCLFYYMQHNYNTVLQTNSINVVNHTLQAVMYIDHNTVKILRLVSNKVKITHAKQHKYTPDSTLFDVLNYCKTTAGAKLLRCFILQPSTDLYTIQQRHQLVNYLCSVDSIYTPLQKILNKFDTLTNIIQQLVSIHLLPQARATQQAIINLINLRQVLTELESLDEIVQHCKISDIHIMHDIFTNPIRVDLINAIETLIEPDTVLEDKNAEATRVNIVVAVKPDINSLLDLARKTFVEYLPKLQQELERVKHEFNTDKIVMSYNTQRHYYLEVPADIVADESKPHILINMYKKRNKIHCSTKLLQQYNIGMNTQYDQIIGLYSRIIEPLLLQIRSQLTWLCQISEAIAYLDVICCYTTIHQININMCQPTLNDNNTTCGAIYIENSRHPILDQNNEKPFISNTIDIGNQTHLQVVTGPNAAGKSVYLHQLVLLMIMAQIGCSIPATSAQISIIYKLYMVVPYQHTLDEGSAFETEMRDVVHMLDTNPIESTDTQRILVLFDELGTTTSTLEGICLVWSILEDLLCRLKCTTVIATHYHELTDLAKLYSEFVVNIHFGVIVHNEHRIEYLYQLQPGTFDPTYHYGIYIAECTGWPEPIITEAKKIAKYIDKSRVNKITTESIDKFLKQKELYNELMTLKNTMLSMDQIKQRMIDIYNKYKDCDILDNTDDKNDECNTVIHTVPFKHFDGDSIMSNSTVSPVKLPAKRQHSDVSTVTTEKQSKAQHVISETTKDIEETDAEHKYDVKHSNAAAVDLMSDSDSSLSSDSSDDDEFTAHNDENQSQNNPTTNNRMFQPLTKTRTMMVDEPIPSQIVIDDMD